VLFNIILGIFYIVFLTLTEKNIHIKIIHGVKPIN